MAKWFSLLFAGDGRAPANEYMIEKKFPKLYSQLNERKRIINYWENDRTKDIPLLIDSGAFSVAHSGKTVDIDEYIQFINDHIDFGIGFAELDEIPFPVLNEQTALASSEGSWKNYLYMIERVKKPLKVLPLYHFGEPFSALERILNTDVIAPGVYPEYIGVGGRHGVDNETQCKYFDKVFEIVRNSKNPDVKIHAFGISTFYILEQFPFFTADSTSWLQNAIYGIICTPYGLFYCGNRSVSGKKLMNVEHLPVNIKTELDAYLRDGVGIRLSELYTNEENTMQDIDYKRQIINLNYYKTLSDNYTLKGRKNLPKKLF